MSVSLFLEFVKKYNLDIVLVKSEQATTTAKEADGSFAVYLCPGDKRLTLRSSLGRCRRGGVACSKKEKSFHNSILSFRKYHQKELEAEKKSGRVIYQRQ